MRRNHFELDLEGEQKAISKAVQIIRGQPDFKLANLRQRRLELYLNEEAVNTTALANVFMALSDNKVTLVSIRSVGQQTEQAFSSWWSRKNHAASPGSTRTGRRLRRNELDACPSRGERGSKNMNVVATQKVVPINRWLPYWAVLQADFGQTLRSWVYRLWVFAVVCTMVGYLVARVAPAREFGMFHTASDFMTDLLRWTVLGSITMIVVLTVGCISGERGTMADSVLSRGISRHQYFLGKWHARLGAVLGTFVVLALLAVVTGLFFLHEDLSLWGSLFALGTVSAMLVFVVTAGVTVSAVASSSILGMALLWVVLYGLGFASSLLPAPFPAPDRALQRLPHILRGNYDAEMLIQLIMACLGSSILMACLGSIYFSRRDV